MFIKEGNLVQLICKIVTIRFQVPYKRCSPRRDPNARDRNSLPAISVCWRRIERGWSWTGAFKVRRYLVDRKLNQSRQTSNSPQEANCGANQTQLLSISDCSLLPCVGYCDIPLEKKACTIINFCIPGCWLNLLPRYFIEIQRDKIFCLCGSKVNREGDHNGLII